MRICPVTGRPHRTPRELAAELAAIDTQLAVLRAVEARFQASRGVALSARAGEIWDALNDEIDALKKERREVEENPRPLRAHEAGTYALVQQNID